MKENVFSFVFVLTYSYLCRPKKQEAMVEYRFRISGVHYAANPEAEAGMPDTEEMHVRTRRKNMLRNRNGI